MVVRLSELNPQWMVCGGEGIHEPTGLACPTCETPRDECRICFGTGRAYRPAPRREGIGVSFDCPCAKCAADRSADPARPYLYRVHVCFRNPLDGGAPFDGAGTKPERPGWERVGDNFDSLITRPSILSDVSKGGCGWHGYIGGPSGDRPGDVVTV